MKNFEAWYEKEIEHVSHINISPEIAAGIKHAVESCWRKAYESIRNEILNNSRRSSRLSIVGFIDEELDE